MLFASHAALFNQTWRVVTYLFEKFNLFFAISFPIKHVIARLFFLESFKKVFILLRYSLHLPLPNVSIKWARSLVIKIVRSCKIIASATSVQPLRLRYNWSNTLRMTYVRMWCHYIRHFFKKYSISLLNLSASIYKNIHTLFASHNTLNLINWNFPSDLPSNICSFLFLIIGYFKELGSLLSTKGLVSLIFYLCTRRLC